MGSCLSHNNSVGVIPIPVSSNESLTHAVVRFENSEKSVQTSVLNLHTEIPVESPSITHDIAVQTDTFDLLTTASMTNGMKIQLQPEIKINPDRTRTIGEDHPKHPRKDLLTNKEYRQHIDTNCNNVKSIDELVTKIVSYSESDLVRAWLIFYWIAKNITFVNGRADNSPEIVIRTRNAVCRGFTNLFSECCGLLNIECIDVPGYVKDNSFRIGDALQEPAHVWNAVKLSGRWYLLDVTWGAGTGKEKKFEESYFLTSPDQMIYTHLPTEDTWQLLSPPITKQEFLDLPLVKSTYYRLNLKMISPKQCVIETNQSLFEVVVKAPSDVTLTTDMKVGDDKCPDYHQLCQYDYTDSTTRCYFSPTNDGKKSILL
jgi:transglutaminase/protease-like cytokinesis protein 3